MCDCEGSNGAAPSRYKISLQFDKEQEERRWNFVNIVYPRLLYIFSDVVCLVTAGSRKANVLLENTLKQYAGVAAAGTVNQSRLPSLIIVFNKVALKEGKWNVLEATSDFSGNQELRLYFSEITVVNIQHM
jgi:hypothetical protein